MKVELAQHQNYVSFQIEPSGEDRLEHGKATLVQSHATFEMPSDFELKDVHPDLLGLASFILCSPWVTRSLDLDFPVSEEFANAVWESSKVDIPFRTATLPPRAPGQRPGLAFSGGVDSMACLELMPDNTVGVFSHRVHSGAPGLYRDEAALFAVESLNSMGRRILKVRNDSESMRSPIGFSVDPSPSISLILLADYLSLDSVAFGTIAESAYRTGSGKFVDYGQRGFFKKWKKAFEGAGLAYFNLVAPISEIGTMIISESSPYAHLAQSCVRGEPNKPCGQCIKCFRKSIVGASVSGDWPGDREIEKLLANRGVRRYLSQAPIRHEIVLSEAMSNYQGRNEFLRNLRDRVCHLGIDSSFTRTWYGPGLSTVTPQKYYEEIREKLDRYLPKMNSEQEYSFQNFDIGPAIEEMDANGELLKWQQFLDSF